MPTSTRPVSPAPAGAGIAARTGSRLASVGPPGSGMKTSTAARREHIAVECDVDVVRQVAELPADPGTLR